MKILHTVESYYPKVCGVQEVIQQISERLVQLGHDVTIATKQLPDRNFSILNGVEIKEFNISGNTVKGFFGEINNYQRYIIGSNFDVIMNYAAQQWATDLILPILNKITAAKVFVPCGFSGLYLPEYKEYFRQMKRWLKQYNACVYASKNYRDINFAKKCEADNYVFIPNGAGENEFGKRPNIDIRKKLNIPSNHFFILQISSHTGAKGHKEAIRIFKKAEIKNATFLIVAKKINGGCSKSCYISKKIFNYSPHQKLSNKKIIINSLSRKEVIAAYQEADLFLFPSNIEYSPLVLFEASASKTPFLTTDVGNAKEIIEWLNGGELLPTIKLMNGYAKADIKKSSEVLQRLFYDQKKRQALANNGYKNWKRSFTWKKIAEQYENLYLNLLDNK